MNLRSLLKRDSHRKMVMIETLYFSGKSYSSEELTKLLSCTTPVLLNDIKLINDQEPYYHIARRNGLYYLEVADNATIDVLYQSLLDQSIPFKMLEIIFFEECYTLQDLTKRLYCSLSTVQANLKELEKELKKWKLRIEKKPFRIEGDEVAIRHLYNILYSEKKISRYELADVHPLSFYQEGEKVIQNFLKKNNFDPCFADFARLNWMFFISLERVARGHRFAPRFLDSKVLQDPDEEVMLRFSKILRNELKLIYSKDVMRESFWLFYADLLMLSSEQIRQVNQTNHSFAYHYEMHYELINRYSNMLVTPLTNQQTELVVANLINQHLFLSKQKEFISLLRDKPGECDMLMLPFHRKSATQIQEIVEDFVEEYQLFQSPEYVKSYVHHIMATLPETLTQLVHSKHVLDVLIVSPDFGDHEILLNEWIRYSVRGSYVIHNIKMSQLREKPYHEIFDDYDVIISTATFDTSKMKTPLLAVEYSPGIRSLNKVQEVINRVYEEKYGKKAAI